MPSVNDLKELEGIIDEMVEHGTSAADILDACQTAIKESLEARGKIMPPKLARECHRIEVEKIRIILEHKGLLR